MGWLEKNFILHERNEKGELIPIEYPVPELGGQKILIMPMTRGELNDFASSRRTILNEMVEEQKDKEIGKTLEGATKRLQERDKAWDEFVLKHILKPQFTMEELRDAKIIQCDGQYKDIIMIFLDAIYAVSGIESIDKAESEIKKK